jgi:hypothetical protein
MFSRVSVGPFKQRLQTCERRSPMEGEKRQTSPDPLTSELISQKTHVIHCLLLGIQRFSATIDTQGNTPRFSPRAVGPTFSP